MAINEPGNLGQDYILMNDIDAEFELFIPIGNLVNPFTGIFDGNGNTISNLTFRSPATDYVGLFGYADGASILNLSLKNIKFEGNNSVGGLIGYANNTSVNQCSVENSNTDKIKGRLYTGGLIGNVTESEISRSYATGEVQGRIGVGGFVGRANRSEILQNYATGEVQGDIWDVGGFAGRVEESKILKSYATGDVQGDQDVGGFVGKANQSEISQSYATGDVQGSQGRVGGFAGNVTESKVLKSYATGEVQGQTQVGGFVGRLDWRSEISQNYAMGNVEGQEHVGGLIGTAVWSEISQSYATGNVKGQRYISGFTGYASSSEISESYATGNVIGNTFVGGFVGRHASSLISDSLYIGSPNSGEGIQVDSDDLKKIVTFTVSPVSTSWSISSSPDPNFVWYIDEGNDYPRFYWEPSYIIDFDSDGGTTVPSQVINRGSAVVEPANPIKTGHTFIEWKEVVSGTTYNFADPVTSNVDLIAIYDIIIITYTVTFDSDSGTTVPNQVINHGSSVVEPTNPTKTGHTFVEWREVVSGTPYNFADHVTSNLDLVAIYKTADSGKGGGTGEAIIMNNTPTQNTPVLENTSTQNTFEPDNTTPQNDTPIPENVVESKSTISPWLLLLIGTFLSIISFFFILYKRQNENQEKGN